MQASEIKAEQRAKIDASIAMIGIRPTIDRIAGDAMAKCAAKEQRTLHPDERAAFYVIAWRFVVGQPERPLTLGEDTTRLAALLMAYPGTPSADVIEALETWAEQAACGQGEAIH